MEKQELLDIILIDSLLNAIPPGGRTSPPPQGGGDLTLRQDVAEKKVWVGVYTPTHTFFSEIPWLQPEQ